MYFKCLHNGITETHKLNKIKAYLTNPMGLWLRKLKYCNILKDATLATILVKRSCGFGIDVYHYQMVVELGEYRLNYLSVLLVQPIWNFKCYVVQGNQVLLYGSTQESFVTKYHTVMVFPQNILQVVEVIHIGCCHIIGMYDTRCATKGMKFIAVIVHVLRGAIALGWSMDYVSLSHWASFSTYILAHLNRLVVNAEHKISIVNNHCKGLTDVLTLQTSLLTTLIELPASDKIRNCIRILSAQMGKEIVLTIDT